MTRLLRIDSDAYHSEAYATDPAPRLSASIATVLLTRSPVHAWAQHPRLGNLGGKQPTKAMDLGSTVHAMVLGKGKSIVSCGFDDWRSKAAKEMRDELRAAGLVPILAADYDEAAKAATAIRAQLDARGIVLDGESEIAIEWDALSAHGPVLCRGMMDHLRESAGVIYDFKTTRDANPTAFAKSCLTYGYDIQHAAYVQALEHLRPELAGRVEMYFLCAELEPPYVVMVGQPSGDMREHGERRWGRALDVWAECLAAGKWPGYGDGTQWICAPPWALAQMEAM